MMYMDAFGESWYDYLLSNGKMLYLQKHADDYFKCSHWPIVQHLQGLSREIVSVPTPIIVQESKEILVPPVAKISAAGLVAPRRAAAA
jgi:hypothetical protein